LLLASFLAMTGRASRWLAMTVVFIENPFFPTYIF